jgi:uncharacterized membrane protein YdjX (TVP38/TMEM64 family)
MYGDHFPVLSIVLFCFAHFISATLSFPGSCSFLNILSGTVFGFWKGVAIVYPITLLSGAFGYFLGTKLPLTFLKKKYNRQIEVLRNNVLDNGYSYLILARLSPLLPYGVINILLGFLKIPFRLYMLTMFVGIFFDVVLLNSVGALFSSNLAATSQDKVTMAIVFFVLFIASIAVNMVMAKRERMSE